jgi:NitT/TauT family transport system permease protein
LIPSVRRYRQPQFWGIHARPDSWLGWLLAVLPFVVLALGYAYASHVRHQVNPDDKVLPTIGQMASAVERMAFQADVRTGQRVMLHDTLSSMKRLALGVSIAAVLGLWLGLNIGLFPGMNAGASPFLTFVSMVPPLAILPMLFITLGVDELAKVALIFIGVFPMIARDMAGTVLRMPREQITKSLTLGANQLQLVYRIVLPQVWPRLIDSVRLSLGAAWLFLIASEAIASDDGLGYRIFLVRRYLAMDVIIPYVLWITAIGFTIDSGLKGLLRWGFPWYVAEQDA